jgi:hypothetical protein
LNDIVAGGYIDLTLKYGAQIKMTAYFGCNQGAQRASPFHEPVPESHVTLVCGVEIIASFLVIFQTMAFVKLYTKFSTTRPVDLSNDSTSVISAKLVMNDGKVFDSYFFFQPWCLVHSGIKVRELFLLPVERCGFGPYTPDDIEKCTGVDPDLDPTTTALTVHGVLAYRIESTPPPETSNGITFVLHDDDDAGEDHPIHCKVCMEEAPDFKEILTLNNVFCVAAHANNQIACNHSE